MHRCYQVCVLAQLVLLLDLGAIGCAHDFICPEGTDLVSTTERLTPESPDMRSVGCVTSEGLLHGAAAKWWGDSLMSVGLYSNGKQQGTHAAWHESGQLWMLAEYRDGEPAGTQTHWNVEGIRIYEKVWTEDQTGSSTVQFWYESGAPKFRVEEEAEEFHGTFESWYESGGRRSEGSYVKAARQGRWTCWDETGEHSVTAVYRGGTVIERSGSVDNEEALHECRDIIPCGGGGSDIASESSCHGSSDDPA